MNSANINDFAVESSSLAGSLQAKLGAVLAAGFSQITLCAQDIISHPDGVDAAVAAVLSSGLQVSGFHTAVNFEGVSGPVHAYKLDVAKAMLSMCHALQCRLLVLPSSTLAQGAGNNVTLVHDLRQLAMLAIPMAIKVAYQGSSTGAVVKDYLQAWDLVCAADMPNLGLCLDTYELLSSGTAPDVMQEDLDMLDPDKVFLVRLADQLGDPKASWRVLPGDGNHSEALAAIVSTLHSLGYRGNYSLAAWNDDYAAMPAQHVAQRAQASAVWVGQDVLQRSVPLPNQIRLCRTAGV